MGLFSNYIATAPLARLFAFVFLFTVCSPLVTNHYLYATQWTETTDADFAGGLFNMTVTSGTGTAAQIVLSPVGTGADGSVTISATKNINSDTISGGRTYADGINYAISAIYVSSVQCSATPNGIVAGDEIILMNMQGCTTDYGNVGNYEFLRVKEVSGSNLVFNSDVLKIYGSTYTQTNSNLLNQKIIVQRVPNWGNVTINSPGILTCSAWDGTKGGMVVFRSTGTVSVDSGASVDVSTKGFRGGVAGTNGAEDARNTNITIGGANGGNGQLNGPGGNGGSGSGGGTGGNGGTGLSGAGGTGGSNGGGGAGSGWQGSATSGAGGAAPFNSGSNYSTETLLMMGGGAAHGGGGGAGSYTTNVPSGGNKNGVGGTCSSGGSGGNGGSGNRGGGIILMYANQISGSGGITSNGGMGGGGGGGGGQGEQNSVAHGGGGGGGAGACGAAGGTVVIKYGSNSGSISISANGGPGGGGGGGGGSGYDNTQGGSGGGGGAGANGGGGGAGRRTGGVGANGGAGGTAGQNIGDGYGGSAGGGGGGYNSNAPANTGGAAIGGGNPGANASGLNGGKGGDLTGSTGGSGGGGGAGAAGVSGYSSIASTGAIYCYPATYHSNILDTGVTGSKFTQVSWNPSSQPEGTSIAVGIRVSSYSFSVGSSTPQWTPATNGVNPDITGRYIQWMSTFTTTISSVTPRLEDLTIVYNSSPVAPAIGLVSGDTYNKITWRWTYPSSEPQPTNFKIYTSTDGLIATLEADNTYYTESGLKRNKEYSRYIQAYNAIISSNSSTVTWRTKPGAFQSKVSQGQPTRTGPNAFGFVGDANWEWDVPVKAGTALTITAYIRYNSDYGAAAKPKLTLSGRGITPTSISATGAAQDAWELLAINPGTPTENAILTLKAEGFSNSPGAKFYIDDINVSQ